jgi:ATP-binding cassette, subfamily B, bacterial
MASAAQAGALTTRTAFDGTPGLRFGSPLAMRMSAVAMILRLHGIEPTDAAALYSQDDDPALERVVQHLRRHGLAPRRIEVAPGELERLRLPTLVQTRSGAMVPLLRVGRRRVTILADDGQRLRLRRAQLARGLSGFALDLCRALPATGRFHRRLLGLLAHHRGLVTRMLLLSGLGTGLSLLAPMISRMVLDRAVPSNDLGLLGAAVLGTLAVGIHQSWLSWLRARVAMALGANVDSAIQHKLFEHSMRVRFADAQKQSPGGFLATLGGSAGLTQLGISGVLIPLLDLGRGAGYLIMLASVLPWLAALSAAAIALCTIVLAIMGRRVLYLERESMRAAGKQRSRLLEILSGVMTLKALGAERRGLALWTPHVRTQRQLAIEQGKASVWMHFWLGCCEKAVGVGLLGLGGAACLDGRLSLGDFMASSMLSTGFVGSMAGVLRNVLPMITASVAVRAVDNLLAIPAGARASAAGPADDVPVGDAIVLNDVWFRYSDDGPWILKNCNLRIPAGTHHPLRGKSGTGKTTILRLIAGLLEPTRGTVRVLGRDPARAPGIAAYLPQEPLLFSGSILSNLRMLSGADEQRLAEAAHQTGLSQLVACLPMKLETVVTPGGSNFSGGQRQLVLLTAAVAAEQPVLLLDESLAHLDPITRAELERRDLFANRTLITVVHDES